jgi:hypothetical protein
MRWERGVQSHGRNVGMLLLNFSTRDLVGFAQRTKRRQGDFVLIADQTVTIPLRGAKLAKMCPAIGH